MQNSNLEVSDRELALAFLKLGLIGFGGPAAHIALMREEFVKTKKWISGEEFQDMVGAVNLIPGPNSTELAIHIGKKLAGTRGLFLAGIAFILPAFLSVLGLAILYTNYGELPDVSPALSGIRPVIVSIVLLALWKFRETAVRNQGEWLMALIAFVLVFLGYPELGIILICGVLMMARGRFKSAVIPLLANFQLTEQASASGLFFYFLKVGSVLFGSGYVLLAFLQKELVAEKGWITGAQLLDAVSVGQITPGPVFTTATFIGYLIARIPGAVLSTIGIFLPSFFFVSLLSRFLGKMRASESYSKFLDGVNAASFALMAFVSVELGRQSLKSLSSVAIFSASLLVLKLTKVNSALVIFAGAIVGILIAG